jgi:hypothetical protein
MRNVSDIKRINRRKIPIQTGDQPRYVAFRPIPRHPFELFVSDFSEVKVNRHAHDQPDAINSGHSTPALVLERCA